MFFLGGTPFDDYGGGISDQAPKKPARGGTPLDDYGGRVSDQAPKKPNSGVTPLAAPFGGKWRVRAERGKAWTRYRAITACAVGLRPADYAERLGRTFGA